MSSAQSFFNDVTGTATFVAPCTGEGSAEGMVRLVVTKQWAKDEYWGIPWKGCPLCRKTRPAIAFLKGVFASDDYPGYGTWKDGRNCHRCEPPEPIQLVFSPELELRMNVLLRHETGAEILKWDRRKLEWLPSARFGMRRMATSGKDRNLLEFQPFTGRHSHPVTGKVYAQA